MLHRPCQKITSTPFEPGSPAWVGEDEHGDFHAWACESGAATVKSDAVEDTEKGKTGHRRGQNCSGWQQATKSRRVMERANHNVYAWGVSESEGVAHERP